MPDPAETAEESLDPASLDCLKKTRSGVLNVLVGVGAGRRALRRLAAAQGEQRQLSPAPDRLNQALFLCLIVIFVVSTVSRRVLGCRAGCAIPTCAGRGSSGGT